MHSNGYLLFESRICPDDNNQITLLCWNDHLVIWFDIIFENYRVYCLFETDCFCGRLHIFINIFPFITHITDWTNVYFKDSKLHDLHEYCHMSIPVQLLRFIKL